MQGVEAIHDNTQVLIMFTFVEAKTTMITYNVVEPIANILLTQTNNKKGFGKVKGFVGNVQGCKRDLEIRKNISNDTREIAWAQLNKNKNLVFIK